MRQPPAFSRKELCMKSILLLCVVTSLAGAQVRIINAGASISVRTNQTIDARQSDGRVFTGVVNQDVTDSNGNLAIPRGAEVELIVRSVSSNDVVLDLESVTTCEASGSAKRWSNLPPSYRTLTVRR